MLDKRQIARYEQLILPHLDSGFNLARWLCGNEHDAEDVVQEASLRALRFFDSFRGEEGRAWFLAVVRNTCLTWMRKKRSQEVLMNFDEERDFTMGRETDPEQALLDRIDAEQMRAAIERLPLEFREALVLREMDGLSYKEIATITEVPLGTVMSRLARARRQLQHLLKECEETRL